MNLLGKAEASGQDHYLALLKYRSTPIENNLPLPAQLLNHRDYPTQLPVSGRLQCSQALASHREQLQNQQNIQRREYDSTSTLELQKPLSRWGGSHVPAKNQQLGLQNRWGKRPVSHGLTLLRQLMGLHELRCNRVQLNSFEKTASQVNSNKEGLSTHRDLSKPSAYPQLSSPELHV